ncbi:hypothetical protein Q1695_002738 [Nippostrongylus brasiliensis]|nr:hypothetical protein Q1695_002738 [Nippostrongylus brasiliensis]
MPGDPPKDNSIIGEGTLSEPPPTTNSIKSILSASACDSILEAADAWLQAAEFFHGYLPREDIPPLLLKHGDFLVRLSEANVKSSEGKKKKAKQKRTSRVISILINSQAKMDLVPLEKRASLIKNIVIMNKRAKWWLDPATQFDNLETLFKHYQTQALAVEKDSVVLSRGVGLSRWEFKHDHVHVGRLLGRGAYGELTMTSLLTRELIREIMKEARIMRGLHHINVVSMVGVVLIDHPLYILLEYVSGGALDVYLKRRHSKIKTEERLAMILGVASGMDYIHKANVIHRDLAARNCLYDRTHTVKISDFGLSRSGTVYKMKTAQKMPIKWMAPESILTFSFTQKTDVYTYGVLIFEIFAAIGPYDDLRNSVVKKMIVEGKVNQFPPNTPDYVVKFVNEKLWCKDPDQRPDFANIVILLEKMIVSKVPGKIEMEERSAATSEAKTTTVDLETTTTVDGLSSEAVKKPEKADEAKQTAHSPALSTAEYVEEPSVSTKKAKESAPPKAKKSPQNTITEEVKTPKYRKKATKAGQPVLSKEMIQSADPTKIQSDASKMGKPATLQSKLAQVDIDSRRDREDFGVEIRTKPVFGRRSKFKRFKKNDGLEPAIPFIISRNEMNLDEVIRDHFAQGPVEHNYSSSFLFELFHRAEVSLERQPSLLEISAPVVIVGDIHGQYGDLLRIFEQCGWPFQTRYLFLGDYVDRGRNSLEVLVLVLALQIRFPRQVFLLRGNHEIKSVNRTYGFYSDLRLRYSNDNECDELLDAVAKVYSQLPLAALLCEKILCLHGGLSPKLQSIDDIRRIKKGTIEPTGLTEDLLWSDPSPCCTGFKTNTDRGCSYVFGSDVVADRCARMGILMIVRGHQAVDEGFEISADRKVITLFSAPGYQDFYVNKGAVMVVSADRTVTFKQFTRQQPTKQSKRTSCIPMSD